MKSLVSALVVASSLLPSALAQGYGLPSTANCTVPFANHTIFNPPSNYTIPRTLYARTVLLNKHCETNNVILATWENYSEEPPYFPIYESDDLGCSWREISRIHDQVNGWGLRYQPFLYELPEAIGNYSAGTILAAGSSIPADLSVTQLELYASTDKGHTWTFISHVARGGRAIPNNGETPVWEPFLMMYEGQLVYYYSDQRDPTAGQKLVHQTTTDLVNWGPVVDDVKYGNYTWRPGMTTVSQLPLGQYIMTYEFYGAVEADFAVYYRVNTNPLNFNASLGRPLIATDGTVPVSSPYNVWTPVGGPLGTIVVSSGTNDEVFLNHNLGAPGAWTKVNSPAGHSYTRNLLVLPNESNILITGAGVLSGTNNSVQASAMSIEPVAPANAQCNARRRKL